MSDPGSGSAAPRRDRVGGAALLLPLFLGAGALLRFAALDSLPPAHYRDIALTATDALRSAAGEPRLHTTYDEGLYSNLMGLVFLVFGPSDWSVRAPGALFGLLTCIGVFGLGRAVGLERAGVWGAGLLAVSSWHVVLSRSGFRAVLLPCLLAFSLALLAAGRRRGGAWRPLLGGALLGLGAHVYPAVRFAPLLFPAYLVVLWRKDPAERVRLRRAAGLFALAALLVAAPLIADYVRHPEHFTYPHRVVSIFSPKLDPGEGARLLPGNLLWTLLMFHARGDANPRHHFPGAPLLDPLTGLLFLAGCAVIRRAGGDGPAAVGAPALLGGWVAAMLLPNLLSVEGVPHGLRSCGAIPAIFLLAGAGLAFVERRLAARFGARAVAAGAVVAVLLAGAWTAERYFRRWGGDPSVVLAHDGALLAAARVLRAAPAGTARFVLANGEGFPAYGHPVETQVFLFELRDDPPVVLGPKDGSRLVLGGRPALIVFQRRDDRALEIVKTLNPGARVEELRRPGLSPDHPVYRIH